MELLELAQQFVWLIDTAPTLEELQKRLAIITIKMGFEFFALVDHLDTPLTSRKFLRMHTYPAALVQVFESRRLMISDPVHRLSQIRSCGFPWSDLHNLLRLTTNDALWMGEARAYGVADGFTVPANIAGETSGSCSFALGSGRAFPRQWLPMIETIGSHAFQRARQILRPRFIGLPSPKLTERQIECIVLLGRGFTAPQSASMIGRGTETVNTHLKIAREAYGAENKAKLLAYTLRDSTVVFDDIF